jgi:hypothetical protein
MHHALCHCSDCRRHAGAPMVGWTMMKAEQLNVTGEVSTYASSQDGRRQFCPRCGTGLFFINEVVLPGLIDVRPVRSTNPRRFRRRLISRWPSGSAGWSGRMSYPRSSGFRPARLMVRMTGGG